MNACPECGQPLADDTAEALCAVCALRSVAANSSRTTPDGALKPNVVVASTVSPTASNLPPGGSLGDYELIEEIARGGMGVVFKARQRSLNRLVALKMVLGGPLASAAAQQRFLAEAQTVASLQHPNIVAIHEVGQHEGQAFFSMDYVPGRSLSEVLRDGPLPPRRAAAYARTIAEAVQYAHQRGVLHRDLKPSNVLIDQADQPRVTDFGLAKRLDDSQLSTLNVQPTLSGQVLGSPNFMSPEQAQGRHREVGPRSDVYSIGALLYHLLTGRPPFQAATLTEVLRQVVAVEPAAPRVLNPALPRDLETICLKCLEKEIPRRYQTAQALGDELGRFLRGEPILARPIGRATKVVKWCRRNPRLAVASAVALLSLLAGLAGVCWQWRRAEWARQDAVTRLWQSCLAQAQADRWSGQAGRRFAGLEAIRTAAAIRPSLELRNEAIACLVLPDARVQRSVHVERPDLTMGFAFDETCERYARACEDGSIQICRVSDGSEIAKLPARGRIGYCTLSFSHGGRFLAHWTHLATSNPFAVWDLRVGRPVLTVAFPVRNADFSPDGERIALAEPDGKIHLYGLATGLELENFSVSPGANNLAFDPAGKRLAISGGQSPSVVILDLQSRSICASFDHAGSIGLIAWAPDGEQLACPSSDQFVYLWNVRTGARKALEGHVGAVTAATFNHLGDLLVSSGWDGVTWFWDPLLGQPLVSLPGGWLASGFDPTDRSLGFGVSGDVGGIWEVDPARECRRLGRTASVWAGEFTADGRVLATASSDGVRLWNVAMNRLLAHLPVAEARSVIWHPNGTNLLVSGAAGIQLWPFELVRDAQEIRVGPGRPLSHLGREQGQLTADRQGLLVAYAGNADLVVFDLQQPARPRLLNGHPGTHFLSISPDGKCFATGTWHGTGVKIWSVATGRPIKELPVKGSARCIFTPDGKWLITGSPEEYCFWRVGAWEPGLKIPREGAGDMYGAMAIPADSRMAALLRGRNRGVKLISLPDGHELATLDAGEPICFSRDGGQLATAGADHRTVLAWDLRLIRQELRALRLDWD